MQVESLAGLEKAFEEWRSRKRYAREAVPADLLAKARQAVRHHGMAAVVRATRVERRHLNLKQGSSGPHRKRVSARVPGFSRIEIAAPVAQPFAEVETAFGLKLRLFAQSEAALEWLSSLCGSGGAR